MKKVIIILVVIILLGIVIVPKVVDKVNKKNGTDVEETSAIGVVAEFVQRGTITNKVELIGTTTADEVINIIPTVPAEVKTIFVEIGDYVEVGDVLYELDSSDVERQVTQAEAGLATATASVEQANLGLKNAYEATSQASLGYEMAVTNYNINYANYQFAVNNLEKYEALYNEGIVSEAEYEQMKLQASEETLTLLNQQLLQAEQGLSQADIGVLNAKAIIKQAEAGLTQAQEGYNTAVEALEDMVFESTIEGYVTAINIAEKQFASNAQPAVIVQGLDSIIIHSNVTEGLVNKISIGQEVEVMIKSVSDEPIKGIIESLSPSADARTLLFPMAIKISNQDNQVKPGMFATVIVEVDQREDILYIPSNAILIRDSQYYVYVISEENKPVLTAIEIGIDTGHFIEVVSGLSEENEIIIKGGSLIDEDTRINVIRGDE